ncbi:histidine phosphatase family protein [Streptosporangium sp. NBC_01639]|uniref:histidine phosphatase family protein n=1 Tax=unclassified Streptosporangium TaxID=2632669 RepID=UPI002DD7F247|nr:histidine phosphatase family protein [Streptosporangium sp. NBC_01756]WSC85653.1 histidine phosphatase family protein [Streptosporangium sp. NBC_01756]WTD55669.1 histidine phosphatase family protein [Streptosporangium sp. NBC_01639]
MTTTVVLARHGRTPWHHPNRYTGRSDIGLDDVGTDQARALAEWAPSQGFTSIASSHLSRAVATLAPVAAALGKHPTVDPRLRELDFGIAEGRTLADVRAEHPEVAARFVADPARDHFPEGEAPADAVARALAGLGDLATADPGGRILVVAHSTLIRLLVCEVLGVPLGDYRRRLPALAPGSTTTFRLSGGDDSAALLAYNVPVSRGWTT